MTIRGVTVGELAASVRLALADVTLRPCDTAAADLALHYAEEIDTGTAELVKLGPALLACLESLGMTPRARKATKEAAGEPPASPLDQLRERRARRAAGD